ncbi:MULTISPECIES: TonB-dependent receptor [unclassified Parabacteroides]|uniref:TonB-dependent receptor n=1 Tax=unclassified Parabacteroides TaxID=2649774 RepID=UPI002476DD2C|nr:MULTISPECIES: TonB-dependent receptor [unclassified Parabacteroides]
MKHTCFMLILFVFQSAATSYAQSTRIDLDVKQSTLKQLFKEIESKTDFTFFYNDEVIDLDRVVDVHARKETVENILNRVLTNCTFTIENKNILLIPKGEEVSSASPQQSTRSITGTITDELGDPVIGANVVEKGTTNGVVTDIDGNFTLTVAENATLQISYIGYMMQEVPVTGRTSFAITLSEDSQALDEVVVIGYGTARKSDLTGAVMRADLSVMQNSSTVNAFQGLKGVVPGLNVGVSTKAGDDPSTSIRGRNSISGTTSPLVVLDGIIYRGNISDINPSDIESIDVLKDASSAAIYGSQAANGVLLITTKNAQSMSKPVIEYNGTFAYQTLIKNLKPLDRDGFIQLLTDSHMNKSRTGSDLHINPDYEITADFMTKEDMDGYANGTNTNWLDLLSEDVPYTQNHNLSLRGRNELVSYFLSFGITDQKNVIVNDTYKRYNFRANIDANVFDWLKVGTQSFFTVSDLSGNNPNFRDVLHTSPLVTPYDENGDPVTLYWRGLVNPLLYLEMPDEEVRYNLSGNFFAEVKLPVKGLSYRINYSHNLTYYKHNLFNPYTNGLLGKAEKNNNFTQSWTLDNIVNYKNRFGKHEVDATFVYGIEKRQYDSTSAAANNFTDQTLGYNSLESGQSDLNVLSSDAWKETSLYMMGRLNYIFNSRYLATATIRYDGFSGFGADNKTGVFPSASLAWRLSEEDFFKDTFEDVIDNLKIRASYGTSGNRTAGRYATMASMSYGNGYVYGEGGSPELKQSINKMSNSELKWETTTSLNLGLDFSLLRGRLSGSYEYYNSKTKNLIYNINIPVMNGVNTTSIATNIGKIKNYGHEFTITGIPVMTKDWEWVSTFNFSLNRNRVVSILGLDTDGDGREDDLVSSKIFINHPYGVVYDYNIIGMWQLDDYNKGIIPQGSTYGTYKVEDINEDGKYSADADRKILGYTDPSYRFSWHNKVRYKNVELSAFINAVQGGSKYYYGTPMSSLGTNVGILTNYFKFDYWTPENTSAKYRQPYQWNQALGSNFHPYQQRSFIRLQELSIAYHLPKSLLKKTFINRAKVFISGTNLFTLTNWEGWDPEANQGLTQDLSGYPTMKNYTIGLNFEL